MGEGSEVIERLPIGSPLLGQIDPLDPLDPLDPIDPTVRLTESGHGVCMLVFHACFS
jgi:hypothetical protein